MMPAAHDSEAALERTRSELRRLGYLDHGLERFLLQDALRPRQPLRTLALLTAKVGVLAGVVLAAALAVALAVANGNLQASPLDLPVLFLHLCVPLSVAAAAAFLALGSRRSPCCASTTSGASRRWRWPPPWWPAWPPCCWRSGRSATAWRRAAPGSARLSGPGRLVAAYALVRLVYQGLLALAIRFSERQPAGGLLAWRWRRWVSGAALASVLLVAVPVMLAARAGEPAVPALLPVGPGARVLVLGLDGVLPEEAEYLLRHGDLPALAQLTRAGGRLLGYERPAEPPAAFWTSVATGLPPGRHGVAALDSFLPLGVRTPLARSGLLRLYWQHVEVPLRLAEYRPLLANRRSAFTFWELASRGGAPVLAVDWWATFPAPPVPGLVLAHDAYQLLQQGSLGALSEPAAAPGLLLMLRRLAAVSQPAAPAAPVSAAASSGDALGSASRGCRAAGGGALAGRGAGRAAGTSSTARCSPPAWGCRPARLSSPARLSPPNRLAPSALLSPPARLCPPARRRRAPRRSLPAPGLDIAASNWQGGDLAFADLVRSELARRRPAARRGAGAAGLGRRRGGAGSRAAAAAGGWREVGERPHPALASRRSLRRWPRRDHPRGRDGRSAAHPPGLPQSAELPPPPQQCAWPAPPARVELYEPSGGAAPAGDRRSMAPPPPSICLEPALPGVACERGRGFGLPSLLRLPWSPRSPLPSRPSSGPPDGSPPAPRPGAVAAENPAAAGPGRPCRGAARALEKRDARPRGRARRPARRDRPAWSCGSDEARRHAVGSGGRRGGCRPGATTGADPPHHRGDRGARRGGATGGGERRRGEPVGGDLAARRRDFQRQLAGLYRLGRQGYLRLFFLLQAGRQPGAVHQADALPGAPRPARRWTITRRRSDHLARRRDPAGGMGARSARAGWASSRRGGASWWRRGSARRWRWRGWRAGAQRPRDRRAAALRRSRAQAGELPRPAPDDHNPATLGGTPMQQFRGILEWPAQGRVAERFGPRLDPRYHTQTPHNGIDLATAAGSEIKVVYPGKVLFAAPFEGYGLTVVVHHPGRVFTLYAGLSELQRAKDDMVSLGETVGLASDRLYFEIRVENHPEDPLSWLALSSAMNRSRLIFLVFSALLVLPMLMTLVLAADPARDSTRADSHGARARSAGASGEEDTFDTYLKYLKVFSEVLGLSARRLRRRTEQRCPDERRPRRGDRRDGSLLGVRAGRRRARLLAGAGCRQAAERARAASGEHGATIVMSVEKGSPADAAQLKVGDLVAKLSRRIDAQPTALEDAGSAGGVGGHQDRHGGDPPGCAGAGDPRASGRSRRRR